MKKKIFPLVGVVAALGLGGWALRAKFRPSDKGKVKTVITVTRGSIEDTVEATGSVAPYNRVEIKPPISGRIERLVVDEGANVKAGDILAWMSSSDRAAILDAARAQGPEELKHWQDAYKPTPIIAPLSGVVILRNVVVGQTVDPSIVLYAMSDYLIVIAQVDESDIGRVHLGMPTRITLDSYPNLSEQGKVFDMLYEGKNVSNVIQYPVKIRLVKAPSYYRSQMTANISFILGKKDDAVLIPATAVKENPDGTKQVSVPGPDGKPIPRDVKTGIENGERVEIVSGLQAGEAILVGQGKYVPQQAQTSPLVGAGKPSTFKGEAPKPKKSS